MHLLRTQYAPRRVLHFVSLRDAREIQSVSSPATPSSVFGARTRSRSARATSFTQTPVEIIRDGIDRDSNVAP